MRPCEQTGGCLRRGLCPPSLTAGPPRGEGQAHGGTRGEPVGAGVTENVRMTGKGQMQATASQERPPTGAEDGARVRAAGCAGRCAPLPGQTLRCEAGQAWAQSGDRRPPRTFPEGRRQAHLAHFSVKCWARDWHSTSIRLGREWLRRRLGGFSPAAERCGQQGPWSPTAAACRFPSRVFHVHH